MKPELYIYTQDCGWRGCIIVISHNEESAREKMKKFKINYEANDPIECHEINENFQFCNLGDC